MHALHSACMSMCCNVLPPAGCTTLPCNALHMQVVHTPNVLRSCMDVDNSGACYNAELMCGSSSEDPPAPVCTAVKAIASMWEVQRTIREHGGVVTRLNVNNPRDFRDFFAAHPTGIYNNSAACSDRSQCGEPFATAVLLVGYDNVAMAWTALGSWGADWADGGTFRITYGIAGASAGGCSVFVSTRACLAALLLSTLPAPP